MNIDLNNKAPLLEIFPKNMTVQHNHNLFFLQFQAWYKKKHYMSHPVYLLYLDSRLVTYLPDLLNIPVMPLPIASISIVSPPEPDLVYIY